MAFKVSNETKVGVLTAISIVLLILGFNFLKGKSLLKKSRYLYARFEKIDGLMPANPVIMNGLAIGSVYTTEPGDADLNTILVTIRLEEAVNIPVNSLATIKGALLGSPSLEIIKGTGDKHLQPGDTLQTKPSVGMLGGVLSKLEPTQRNLDNVLLSVDTLLLKINNTLNQQAQADLQKSLSNLSVVTGNLAQATVSINSMLNAQTGALAKTLNNLQSFSQVLAESKNKIPTILNNFEKTSESLSRMELEKTVQSLNKTLADVNNIVSKANSTNGTLGSLINDKKLYNNLTSTVNSLNLLMQDLRLNPKRYVNISVFGKKTKSEPLMRPMVEDSITQEQLRNP